MQNKDKICTRISVLENKYSAEKHF